MPASRRTSCSGLGSVTLDRTPLAVIERALSGSGSPVRARRAGSARRAAALPAVAVLERVPGGAGVRQRTAHAWTHSRTGRALKRALETYTCRRVPPWLHERRGDGVSGSWKHQAMGLDLDGTWVDRATTAWASTARMPRPWRARRPSPEEDRRDTPGPPAGRAAYDGRRGHAEREAPMSPKTDWWLPRGSVRPRPGTLSDRDTTVGRARTRLPR